MADALARARAAGLDLVEIAPAADPPVCRIMDYSRWRYEHSRVARRSARTAAGDHKEMRLRPHTGDHDLAVKARKVAQMLADGHRVKVTVRSRGRVLAHPDLAVATLQAFVPAG